MSVYYNAGFYIQRGMGGERSILDCVRDDKLPPEAINDSCEAVVCVRVCVCVFYILRLWLVTRFPRSPIGERLAGGEPRVSRSVYRLLFKRTDSLARSHSCRGRKGQSRVDLLRQWPMAIQERGNETSRAAVPLSKARDTCLPRGWFMARCCRHHTTAHCSASPR